MAEHADRAELCHALSERHKLQDSSKGRAHEGAVEGRNKNALPLVGLLFAEFYDVRELFEKYIYPFDKIITFNLFIYELSFINSNYVVAFNVFNLTK